MPTQKFSNNASSLLAVSIGTGDLSVQVDSGGGAEFPTVGVDEYYIVAIENALGDIEYCKVTARTGDVLTVVRAQEGSIARAFTASQARVELRATKETMERFVQHDAGVVNRDLTIPNLTVSAVFTGASGSFSSNVTIGGTLGVTGAFTGGAGTFSTSLTVAGVSVRNATLFNTGLLDDARLSSNIPRLNASAAFTAALSATGTITGSGLISASRIAAGYDSGGAGSIGASAWFYSSGATGWYNATYSGGINMEDTTFVRVYGSKNFLVSAGIYATGDITAYYSDERLKTRVGNITDALQKLCSLDGFTYVENELARSLGYQNLAVQVGLSAQQIQKVLPEVVSLAPADFEVKDGNVVSKSGQEYLTVNYARLVPLLVEAIKELTARVAELETKA